jgi:hypothetical protein
MGCPYGFIEGHSAVQGGTMPTAKDSWFVRNGAIVLLRNGLSEYPIETDRCNTPEKILGWVAHLGGKSWITPRQLKLFVKYAFEANGIEIDYSG